MINLRSASLEEVLRVAPENADTHGTIRDCGGKRWWELGLERSDVGAIGAQSVRAPFGIGSVASLYQERLEWMTTDAGADDLLKHRFFLRELEGPGIRNPPILISNPATGWNRQIIDGAHRIYAAYEFMERHSDCVLRVFWNRSG